MPRLLHRYATPLVTGLFLVSLVSGVALVLGVGRGVFREMHEILSLVLVVPFALHLWRNWRAFAGYLRRPPMAVALALSALLALGFAPGGTGGGSGGPPQAALAQALLAHSLAEVAPALGATPEDLAARLDAAGFAATVAVGGGDATLASIAAASGRDPQALVAALLPPAG